jgi:hypothetical protein
MGCCANDDDDNLFVEFYTLLLYCEHFVTCNNHIPLYVRVRYLPLMINYM